MANSQYGIKEVRFVIEPELTQVYVALELVGGDNPIGVQGWHHKTFPASRSIQDLMPELRDAVLWGLEAPARP